MARGRRTRWLVYGSLAGVATAAFVGIQLVRSGVIALPEMDEAPPRVEYPPRITLEELIDTYRRSGHPFQNGVEAILLQGVLQTPDGPVGVVREVARGGRARFLVGSELGIQSGWIVDGERAWVIEDGRVREAGDRGAALRVLAEHDPLFVDAAARGHRVVKFERRTGGGGGYVIEVLARDGSTWEYEVRPGRCVVHKVTQTWPDDGSGALRIETVNELEFGISRGQFVFQKGTITRGVGDQRDVQHLHWSRLAVAPRIDAERFRPQGLPDGAPPPSEGGDGG